MTALLQHQAERIENLLGDPMDDGSVFSWASAMRSDEAETLPTAALEKLEDLGLASLLVPREYGGAFDSYDTLYALSRALSRRDPALALSFAMKSWSQLVWIAGSVAQKARVAEHVVGMRGSLCLGVSERERGADLMAGQVSARAEGDGFVLDGEKWPIGAAARAEIAFVLARDPAVKGPRALSWFMLEKSRLAPGSCRALPKVRTLGLRAAELAGLELHGARVGTDALIGPKGHGLDLTLKLFQLTRPLVTGLSLGAADTALRLAAQFAHSRILYGRPVAAIPQARETLAGAYLDLIAAEVLLLSCVRGIHASPHELSVTSLIAKALVPELAGRSMRASMEVLGARFYLREGFGHGIFQKLLRDHAAIELFDGSTAVCLSALAAQIPELVKGPSELAVAPPAQRDERLALRMDPERELPAFDPTRLELIARGCDDVVQGYRAHAGGEWLSRWEDLQRAASGGESARSPALAAAARDYCALHASAACLLWRSAPVREILEGAAHRILLPGRPLDEGRREAAFTGLADAWKGKQSFSVLPVALPDGEIR